MHRAHSYKVDGKARKGGTRLKRLLLALALIFIALSAETSCSVPTGGTPLSPCHSQDINGYYPQMGSSNWTVDIRGMLAGYTVPDNPWSVKNDASIQAGERIQYASYEFRVLRANSAQHTMSVQFLQSC